MISPWIRRGLVLAMLLWGWSTVVAEEKPRDLGDRLELFVDRHMIESLNGVRHVMHAPRLAEIAVQFDKPWEGLLCGYVTVFKDGDTFRMYYRGWPKVTPGKHDATDDAQVACYAESTDGIHWTKPNLGLFERDGSKDNNIVWQSTDHIAHNFTPFKDTRPGVSADELYKATNGQIFDEKADRRGLFMLASPDGLRWRILSDKPLGLHGAFDSQNPVFWDQQRGRYAAYFRVFFKPDVPSRDNRGEELMVYKKGKLRGVATATSDDGVHWSETVPIDFGDTKVEHFYTNATVPYFRAPHYYFMFPKRFQEERKRLLEHKETGISDAVFLSSRDGLHFDWTFQEALIRPGRHELNWGDRSTMVAWGLVQTAPDEMSVYVSQHPRYPSYHVRRGVWRLDGIASVQAGHEPGEIVTRPFTFSGRHLVLNYATSAAGSVQVEIQGLDGRPLAGFALADANELFGDEITGTYSWKSGGDVSSLAGRPVRLRFVLKDADVYSYRFSK
jgi:hypothetical protein